MTTKTKAKTNKVRPVWADTKANRKRIAGWLNEGKTVEDIGREFGVSRSRIAPLVNAVRAEQEKQRDNLVWLMTGYFDGGTIMFNGTSAGPHTQRVPQLYRRDRYPYADVIKAPLVKDFGKAIRHFYYRKPKPNAGPIQIPASMMAQFSFTKKEIRLAHELAM